MRKRFSVIFLGLLLAIALLVVYVWQPWRSTITIQIPYAGNEGSVTATLNCALPKVPEQIPTLKISKKNYASNEAYQIARELFNMTGELSPYGTYGFRNGTSQLILGSDGSIWFAFYVSQSYYPLKVSLQKAKDVADAFIAKVEKYGLRPGGVHIEFLGVEPAEHYGIEGETYPVKARVSYRTLFNGFPIFRGNIHIDIGGNGEILECLMAWRNVEADSPIQITVSPTEALNKLSACWSFPLGPDVTRITINKVELGYLADPAPSEQSEMFPVYGFECEIFFKNGSSQKYVTFVSAT